MHLSKRIRLQLLVFAVVSSVAIGYMAVRYVNLPTLWFDAGHYEVTVQLPAAAGLYASGNVTYRGIEVGRVRDVRLTDDGVEATLSLTSGIDIPSDLSAQVHSQSAIGEQYVALTPENGGSRPLRDGDVIPIQRTSIPPDVNALLGAANDGLKAIPRDNLKTVVDESYKAFGGLGPELSRFIKGSTELSVDAAKNLDALTGLIDGTAPVLNSQIDSADAIAAWSAHVASVAGQLQAQDPALAGVLQKIGPTADEARRLFDRLKPTLPILLSNLVSIGQVAVTYASGIEQLLVLLPHGVAIMQGAIAPTLNTKNPGLMLGLTTSLNTPRPCVTGFLPASQRRTTAEVDSPDRPAGDLYCRIPQDSPDNVRGIRNIPCETKPWKRAPTAAICESDAEYVPLNDGDAWKGDPNATLSGQPIPQPRDAPLGVAVDPGTATRVPAASDPLPPIAVAEYDPATGSYVAPDGKTYVQRDLANTSPPQSWQSMLVPPG